MLGGICFCRPGYKKVNSQCVISDSHEILQPLYEETPFNTSPTSDNSFTGKVGSSEPSYCPTSFESPFVPSTCGVKPTYPEPISCSSDCQVQECTPPAVLSPCGKCECPEGFIEHEGECKSCPEPGVFDFSTGKCEFHCG